MIVPPTSHQPSASLTILLFGSFEIRLNGEPLRRLRSRRGQWLLALLALRQGREIQRAWLVETLWPESLEKQAYANLRQCLTDLRRVLGEQAYRLRSPSSRTLCLDLSDSEVDVTVFDRCIVSGKLSDLESAVRLRRAPLLEDCAEEWVLAERVQREEQYLTSLEALASSAVAQGQPHHAVEWLRQVIVADPLRETAQRALMSALANCGDNAAVIQTYRDLRLLLRRKFSKSAVEPDSATTALFQQLQAQARQRSQLPVPASSSITAGPPPCRLPQPLTDIVGREEEIAQVKGCLTVSRLVTLTGAGGIGKTRLAVQAAQDEVEFYADGVWFVDLGNITRPELLLQEIATVMDVKSEAACPLLQTLVRIITPKYLLLVLDNCEHLIEACVHAIDALLSACRGLRILATSRQALGIAGEIAWQVSPLAYGDENESSLLDEDRPDQAWKGAIQLFAQRASAVQNDFQITQENVRVVQQICRRLDGLPLAIELAAAHVKYQSLEELSWCLHDQHILLSGKNRVAISRHQSLLATLDWSYALLSEPERALLKKLSVFGGGWTRLAAEAVGAEGDFNGRDVFEVLTLLIDKSLVVMESLCGSTRYRLLETVQKYAQLLLDAHEGGRKAYRQHQEYFLHLAETAHVHLKGGDEEACLNQLEAEQGNFRRALDWCLHTLEAEAGLRMVVALHPFWLTRGYFREGQQWLERTLDVSRGMATWARAKALNAAGTMAKELGDYEQAQVLFEQSCELSERLEQKESVVACLNNLAELARLRGDMAQAKALHEQCLALRQEHNDALGIAASLNNLGLLAYYQADYESARSLFEQSLGLWSQHQDRGTADCLNNLGLVAYDQSDYASARTFYEKSLHIQQKLKNKAGIAAALGNLANLAADEGEYALARSLYEESLALRRELQQPRGVAIALNNLGLLAYDQGEYGRAYTLYQDSLILRERLGDKQGVAETLHNLGEVAGALGDTYGEHTYYEQSLVLKREVGDANGIGLSVYRLGRAAFAAGDVETAEALHLESLTLWRKMGNKQGVAQALEALAGLHSRKGRFTVAVKLLGAAQHIRETIHAPRHPCDTGEYERMVTESHASLDRDSYAEAWAEGFAMTEDEVFCRAYSANQ